MNILGLACYYHDAAACLYQQGKPTVAVQEERFNRQKHCAEFPLISINHAIQAGGITFDDIDFVGFYEKPYLKFARVVLDHLRAYPFSFPHFSRTIPLWLQDRLILPVTLKKTINYTGKTLFIKHHLAHAASAFLVSPFDQAAIITADGVGEVASLTVGIGRGSEIEILREIQYPHSVGLLYSALTTYLGFRANGGEGKVMGLAAYGEPTYLDQLRQIVDVKPDGSFQLDLSYFSYIEGKRMYTKKFLDAFGPERLPESEFERRHYDIAASLQTLTEEILIRIARNLQNETGLTRLCLAGGVFLNCLTNHKILERTPFERVFVQPAAGDSGGALGVAAYIAHTLQGAPREYVMRDAYLGPEYGGHQIRRQLELSGVGYRQLTEEELHEAVARLLYERKVVGWFQGRMEFGPRALGNRSILGNPCVPEMKDILNERIKKRESFRPFAPAVLAERAADYFEILDESPFMVLAPRVRPEKREVIPSVTHVDGTARVQTVEESANPRFYRLIKAFERYSHVPVILNTSFNQRGEPIVCSPEDAIDCYQRSDMDALAIGDFLVERPGSS